MKPKHTELFTIDRSRPDVVKASEPSVKEKPRKARVKVEEVIIPVCQCQQKSGSIGGFNDW
jgi:hypothetical protein